MDQYELLDKLESLPLKELEKIKQENIKHNVRRWSVAAKKHGRVGATKDEDGDKDESTSTSDTKTKKPLCISFMIFRTGSVLIVGKCNNTSIIYEIYDFIKHILTENYKTIYAINNEVTQPSVVKKKKIKKKQIVCYV